MSNVVAAANSPLLPGGPFGQQRDTEFTWQSLLCGKGRIFHLGEIKSQLLEVTLNTVILQISRNYVHSSWAAGAFLLFQCTINYIYKTLNRNLLGQNSHGFVHSKNNFFFSWSGF